MSIVPEEEYCPATRYVAWALLDQSVRQIAGLPEGLSYVETTWNYEEFNEVEGLDFSSIDVNQQAGATQLGYDEETWDCCLNHYSWYDWSELVTWDLDQYFMALGWTEASWDDGDEAGYPASESKAWFELTPEEQLAATELCYDEWTWDVIPLTQWEENQWSAPTSAPVATDEPQPSFCRGREMDDCESNAVCKWKSNPNKLKCVDLCQGYNEGRCTHEEAGKWCRWKAGPGKCTNKCTGYNQNRCSVTEGCNWDVPQTACETLAIE